MFGARFFGIRFFAPRYWGKHGATSTFQIAWARNANAVIGRGAP